ncbi:hypothetical protein [Microbacterium xanthum]|uniref:hypothetical protein n=1 Tax=Microbacterium xanthum TaxID=3079794 RepID=UPI002AD3107E|nr:hypothetical protein [Microbacterium sp. KSW-48]MDZ8170765.1 hypothetical protein [Microbacterium sp. KSW-48]
MTLGNSAGKKPENARRSHGICRLSSEVRRDFKTHKTAYIAALVGIAAMTAAVFITTNESGGWIGPTLLSLAILMISIGFVGYQMADAKRTDEQLAALAGKLRTIEEKVDHLKSPPREAKFSFARRLCSRWR